MPAHVHERAEGVRDEDIRHGDAHLGQGRQARVNGSHRVVGDILGPLHDDSGRHGGEEDVLVAPDDPFGVSRRPPGVGDVDVIGGPGSESRPSGELAASSAS